MVTLCLQVIRRMEGKLTWLKEPLPVQSRRQSVNPSGEQPFVSGPTANTHTHIHTQLHSSHPTPAANQHLGFLHALINSASIHGCRQLRQ